MTAPSLLGSARPPAPQHGARVSVVEAKTLIDLMYDGFYMLFLLRNRHAPPDAGQFRARLKDFLAEVDKGARRLNVSPDDLHLAKYAYCALVDEQVLLHQPTLRASWEQRPLQLEMFGDQLAGEHFFDRLEELRQQGAARLQVLEVFHMCLLMGFQGKYLLEGSEKLGYLSSRLGDEIAHLKGRRAEFAPHAMPPDRIIHKLRAEVPLWVVCSVFALAGLLAFLGLRWNLGRQTQADLGLHTQVIQSPAQTARVTITLP